MLATKIPYIIDDNEIPVREKVFRLSNQSQQKQPKNDQKYFT